MKAAVIGENGLEIRDVPVPEPKANEVLVKVRAAALNRADLLMVAGGHGFADSTVAGLVMHQLKDLWKRSAPM